MKTIRMIIREVVCEEYRNEITQEDWENEMDRLSRFAEETLEYQQYLALKDLSWEQVIAAVDYEDVIYTITYRKRTYRLSLADFVSEMMRDGAYDMGPVDSWGLDDREEELEVGER